MSAADKKPKVTAEDVVKKAMAAMTPEEKLADLANRVNNLEARLPPVRDQAEAAANVAKELLGRVGILEKTIGDDETKRLLQDLTAAILVAKGVSATGAAPPAQQTLGPSPFNTTPPATPPGYFNEALLSRVQWKAGQYEGSEYAFAADYPDLAAALNAAGGKVQMTDYTVSIGKNPKYINKNPRKGSNGTGYKARAPPPAGGGYTGQAMQNPDGPASPKQLETLEKFGVHGFNGSKAQASQLIGQKIAESKSRR